MYSRFCQSLSQVPQNIAFVLSNKKAISYQQASTIINQWCQWLLSLDIAQEDRVAVLTSEEDLYIFCIWLSINLMQPLFHLTQNCLLGNWN